MSEKTSTAVASAEGICVGIAGGGGVETKPSSSAVPGSTMEVEQQGQGGGEATADDSSAFSNDMSGPYQVIEYDLDGDGDSVDLVGDSLMELQTLTIDEDSPAAEAIRANANVRVSTFGKAARAMHIQSVRKFVKRATGATKSGVVRGKPPRIPLQGETDEEEGSETDAINDGAPSRSATTMRSFPASGGSHLDTVQEEHEVHDSQQSASSPPIAAATTPSTEPTDMMSDSSQPFTRTASGNIIADVDQLPDTVVQGTVEASKKVLRSVDPHDLLKLLRWKSRRRKGTDRKSPVTKSYVKGKVIDGQHELYTLSIAVMIGVRTSILQTNMEINNGSEKRRWVKPQDFRATEKYEFRPKGGQQTPPHQLSHTFKFKDYAPVVFSYLRRIAGVNEFDFLLSVCGNANFIEFISNAKSGQFFFYSSDGRFMIKTMTNAESKFLRRMLPQYFRHCVENPNTMVTKFFGMYRVKLYHLRRNVKFVIMNSVYYTDKYLQSFYDLKGSSIGRDAKPGQAVKKDNDLRRSLPEEALSLSPDVRSRVRQQVHDDCAFLQSVGVMDYSMLVGVHHVPHTDDRSIATSGFQGNRSSRLLQRRGSSKGRGHEEEFQPEYAAAMDHDHDTKSSSVGTALSNLNSPHGSPTHSPDYFQEEGLNRPALQRRSHCDNLLFLEELDEDESSYLAGSLHRQSTVQSDCIPRTVGYVESERKKQFTVEKLYWPYHRMYDIHGFRRLLPVECPTCSQCPCNCHAKEDAEILQGYNVPLFVPPLSDRKDGGLEMDTTGRELPMVFRGPKGAQLFGGKIFYMGIIDVLQEYTSRKAVEAQYRYMQTHGRPEASCVPPSEYADRFLKFFDELTVTMPMNKDEGVEVSAKGEVLNILPPQSDETLKEKSAVTAKQ